MQFLSVLRELDTTQRKVVLASFLGWTLDAFDYFLLVFVIPEVAKDFHVGIAEVTFYRWRKKYGGMSVSEAARLRELERENARLKRLLAERDLELDATKEFLAKKL